MNYQIVRQGHSLRVPKMTVDAPLDPKRDMGPFPNTYSRVAIVGGPGVGKTSLLISALDDPGVWGGLFHRVYVIMPSTSVNSMESDPFATLPSGDRFDELNEEILAGIGERLEDNSRRGLSSLLVIDDFASDLRKATIQRALIGLANRNRHIRTTVVLIAQTYKSLPPPYRRVMNFVAMFQGSRQDLGSVVEEKLVGLEPSEGIHLVERLFEMVPRPPPGQTSHAWVGIRPDRRLDDGRLWLVHDKAFDKIVINV